ARDRRRPRCSEPAERCHWHSANRTSRRRTIVARLDDRLRRDLERAARPADPAGVYEELIRRRERRRIARRIEATALAVAVVAGTIAGTYGLSRVFWADTTTPRGRGSPSVSAPPTSPSPSPQATSDI